jgi:ketosteroid isomerase-like protein
METYGRLIAAFNEGGTDAALEFFAEDAELYDPDLPGNAPVRGRQAVGEMLRQMMSGNESTEVRGFEVLPAGDRVVALTHTYARGHGGAPEVEVRDGHILTFRDGKVAYWRMYTDRNEALADAGLGASTERGDAAVDSASPGNAGASP